MLYLQVQICLQMQEGFSKGQAPAARHAGLSGHHSGQLQAVVEAMQTLELF